MSEQSSTVACPSCGQTYSVTPEQRAQYGDQAITCTRCQQPFTADGPAVGGPAAQPPPFPPGGVPVAGQPPVAGYATPGPYGSPYGATPPPREHTTGWATASLVFGILSFCLPVIATIVAVVTGIVALSKTNRPGVGGRGMAIAGMSLGVVAIGFSAMFMSILLPSLNRAREQANRIKCASNLRQIGQAVQIYANENRGAYPDALDPLVLQELLEPDTLVCPSSNDTPATGGSPQAQVADLANPGRLSYVYLGKGMNFRSGGDVILAHEPVANHRNDGMNVLYGDGHVEFKGKQLAATILGELQSGQNPPPSDRPGP